MSNLHNEQQLENIHMQTIEHDRKGLIDDDVSHIAIMYNLHQDDDRDMILQFISESIFYNNSEGYPV